MDLQKALYRAQLSNPEGREKVVVELADDVVQMSRAEMAATRGVEFEYQGNLPNGRPLYKAVMPNSGQSGNLSKSANRNSDSRLTFGDCLQVMHDRAAARSAYSRWDG